MRVENIKKIIDAGDLNKADDALDVLLSLGPSNIKALKLKASLLNLQGRFDAERQIWAKIHALDAEDLDSIRFLQRKQREDREFFYFTDELPSGRKFLAYPKSTAIASIIGLLGCVLFFLIANLAKTYAILSSKEAVLTTFIFCVILPWVLIVYRYLTALVFVDVTNSSILIKSRMRSLDYRWEELSKVYLAHSKDHYTRHLLLVLLPKDPIQPAVKIDVSDGSSTLCAKSYLIAEIRKFFTDLEHTQYSGLRIDNKTSVSY